MRCSSSTTTAPACKKLLDIGQIGNQDSHMQLGAPLGYSAQKNHRRPLFIAQREQCTEIGVGRNDHMIFTDASVEYLLVL